MWHVSPQMFGCRKKMSAIAILDYSGAEAVFHHMESLAQEGRQSWVTHHGSGSPSAGSGPSPQPQPQPAAVTFRCMLAACMRRPAGDVSFSHSPSFVCSADSMAV